jgi:hypothetical protein
MPHPQFAPESGAANAERVAPSEVLAGRMVALQPEKGKGYVANVLPEEKRVRVLAALLDGNNIRAVERMVDVNHRAITRLLLAPGRCACMTGWSWSRSTKSGATPRRSRRA